jgi:DNA-binding GntR family transcriptional regulator
MNLKKKVIRGIREAILNKEFQPGEPLREFALCERFGVSRTPVREALQQLEREGFVYINPGAGAKVAKLSIKEILKIYDVLIVLEGAACKLACSDITKDEIAKLDEYNFLFEKAMDQANNDLIYEINANFHWLITEATRNSYLVDLRSNFRRLVNPITRFFPLIPGQHSATLEDHGKIIEALKVGNPAMAEFVMKEHLEKAKRNLERYLQTTNDTFL